MKQDLQKYFTNSEIFEIFKNNKRILLFLIEGRVIIIDEYIVSRITSYEFDRKNYREYFLPEIKPFLTKEFIQKYRNKTTNLQEDEFLDKLK